MDERPERLVEIRDTGEWTILPWVIAVLLLFGGLGAGLYYSGVTIQDIAATSPQIVSPGQTGDNPDPKHSQLWNERRIDPVPARVSRQANITQQLDVLIRERCDWEATWKAGEALSKATYKRQAAQLYISYTEVCNFSDTALLSASSIFYDLADFEAALNASDRILARQTDRPDPHYYRALALAKMGRYQEAIDSLQSTIEVHPDLDHISSAVFYLQSKSYEALGDACGAIGPIEDWMSLMPENEGNRHAQTMVEGLKKRGSCPARRASGSDNFRIKDSDVIIANVSVNGTLGRFAVDTGASMVSLSAAFAKKANVVPTSNIVTIMTANGTAKASRATIKTIGLGQAKAEEVLALVQIDQDEGYGDLDGLLGRSFLSRFDISFTSNRWTIKSR